MCNLNGVPLDDLIVASANQEHGIVTKRNGDAIDPARFPVGTLFRVLPNHACATAAQHDAYAVVNDTGEVEAAWPRFSGWGTVAFGTFHTGDPRGVAFIMNRHFLPV